MREGALPSRTNQARVVSEILDMAKREKFRVNLIEAYDQPWKRQLEGTVGGNWGLIDANRRKLKYPAGEPISNFPLWKIQAGAGMGLCVLIFAVAMLSLRRRPWTPRLISWIAVAVSATSAGILLGIAADKLCYESYGFGNSLRWGLLLAVGVISPLLCANALMSGRALPTFIELIGPRPGRTSSVLTVMLGITLLVTTLIGAETALGFVFDPRYRDFPFARADNGGGAVLGAGVAQSPARRQPSDRGVGVRRSAGDRGRLCRDSMKVRTTGSRSGPAWSMPCSASRCGGRGPRKSQNKQRRPRDRRVRRCKAQFRSRRR